MEIPLHYWHCIPCLYWKFLYYLTQSSSNPILSKLGDQRLCFCNVFFQTCYPYTENNSSGYLICRFLYPHWNFLYIFCEAYSKLVHYHRGNCYFIHLAHHSYVYKFQYDFVLLLLQKHDNSYSLLGVDLSLFFFFFQFYLFILLPSETALFSHFQSFVHDSYCCWNSISGTWPNQSASLFFPCLFLFFFSLPGSYKILVFKTLAAFPCFLSSDSSIKIFSDPTSVSLMKIFI